MWKKIKASPRQHSSPPPVNALKSAEMKASDAQKSTCDDSGSHYCKENWQETEKAENIYSAIDDEDLYTHLGLDAVVKKEEEEDYIVPVHN